MGPAMWHSLKITDSPLSWRGIVRAVAVKDQMLISQRQVQGSNPSWHTHAHNARKGILVRPEAECKCDNYTAVGDYTVVQFPKQATGDWLGQGCWLRVSLGTEYGIQGLGRSCSLRRQVSVVSECLLSSSFFLSWVLWNLNLMCIEHSI